MSAAVLQQYGLNSGEDVGLIQQKLALIESCFHGTSSGFDPLISYFQRGCLVQNKNTLLLKDTYTINEKLKSRLYLIDSNTTRTSLSPIQWFYEQINSGAFQTELQELNEVNSLFIRNVLDTDPFIISSLFQKISSIQFEIFQPLIVPSVKKIWKLGLQQGTYFCKLCGKGGGGFYYVWLNEEYPGLIQHEYPELQFVSIQ
ncbi:MAG: hypothetical protein ABIR66_00460 [Saprospiraceae bacterium]